MATRASTLLAGFLAAFFCFVRKSSAQTLNYKGRQYISVGYIGSKYGMTRVSSAKSEIYRNKWTTLEFEKDSRKCKINGVTIWLMHPVRNVYGSWAIYKKDFDLTIMPILVPANVLKSVPTNLVVIDPGHGGKDDGAVGRRNVKERLVVMDISKRVERELKSNGIKVLKTRTRDAYLGLSDRSAYVARVGASLFVSIHMNASSDRSVCGTETYILTPSGEDSTNSYGQPGTKSACRGNRFDAANAVLGYRVQNALLKSAKRPDRGLKRARFKVLTDLSCPGVLVEGAFISNSDEESKMIDASFRESVAQGISTGVREYLSLAKKARA